MNKSGLIGAIHTRRPTRSYLDQPLSKAHLHALLQCIDTIETPFECDAAISLHLANDYLPTRGPVHFAALRGGADILSQTKAGFAGELFLLTAESLGICTSWHEGYKQNTVFKAVYGGPIPDDEKVIYAVAPLGYPSDRPGKAPGKSPSTVPDKGDINQYPNPAEQPPLHIRNALGLACMAPPATKDQSYQYKVSHNAEGFTVEIGKPEGCRRFKSKYPYIDMGTAACRFWLGLFDAEIKPQVTLHEESGCAVWTFTICE